MKKKTIASESVNHMINSEITKPTDDDTCKNENKRKCTKNFIDNHVEQYYFYDNLLK